MMAETPRELNARFRSLVRAWPQTPEVSSELVREGIDLSRSAARLLKPSDPLFREIGAWCMRESMPWASVEVLDILRAANGSGADVMQELCRVFGITDDEIAGDITVRVPAHAWDHFVQSVRVVREDASPANLCALADEAKVIAQGEVLCDA